MAQYYQVLSQDDKNSVEELRQYYPNLVENQTVQYVINPEDQHQQFQGQQILLSSDQLMVIDNRNQHVIVDQSGTYQNSQYVLQDGGTVEYQETHPQQVYYMEEVDTDHSVQSEQSTAQSIVLNNPIQQSSLIQTQINNAQKTVLPIQVRQTQVQQIQQQQNRQLQTQSSVRQILQQTQTVSVQQDHQQVTQRTPIQQMRQPQIQRTPQLIHQHQQSGMSVLQKTTNRAALRVGTAANHELPPLHYTQPKPKQTDLVENESHEAVALADGRVMSITDYKKMLAENQRPNSMGSSQIPERTESPLIKYGINANQNQKPKNRAPRRRFAPRVNNNSSTPYTVQDNSDQIKQPFIGSSLLNKNQNQKQPNMVQNHFMQQQQQQILQHQQLQSHHQQHQCTQQSQSHPVQQTQSYVQPQYIIQPPSQHQPHSHGPLPPYVASRQIQQIIENTPISEEFSDSIRMLVLLESGEQRLITFTLPKEVCTIQEILEQVGVPFQSDTRIELTETSYAGIHYIVTVGSPHSEVFAHKKESDDTEQHSINTQSNSIKPLETLPSASAEIIASKTPTPEPQVEIETPHYISGLLAVCNHCGYTSENFNRCLRCRFKLPEDVKTVPTAMNNEKKPEGIKVLQSPDKKLPGCRPNVSIKFPNGPVKRKKPKMIDPEPVVLTLSSDEEEEPTSQNQLSETEQLIRKLSSSSVTLSAIKKEPSISDIQQTSDLDFNTTVKGGGKDDFSDMPGISLKLECRTIRIGSYKYIPTENLILNPKELILKVPHPKDHTLMKTIIIERKHIVKILASFHKALPVFFYYVMSSVAHYIRDELDMIEGEEMYFDPLSKEESYKRITILPENICEEARTIFRYIYGKPVNIMDELTSIEANDLLVMTCPVEVSKVIASAGYAEVKQLLIYPPGKGGLSINTEDYFCLAQDQFINDVIIDFYLKYLVLNLPLEQQEKVHVFSTFFYKRLTTKPTKASRRSHPAEVDPALTAAQKRHARVEKWTKSVNLFEKDFIIIPINESCHWFLAIICFPGLDGCVSLEDGKSISIVPKLKRKKSMTTTIGNVTITTVKQEKEEKAINCDENDGSDKDEAEGDDSELDSGEDGDESEPEKVQTLRRPPIKQPCILIFDSLAGASRNRVVATLRDYLTCEYRIKMGREKIFNKDVIKGSCPKVPQQNNFTDCGLYLLQYVEHFFKDPITDYHRPIKQIENWFDEFVVTKKREDISNLIKDLMEKYNKDVGTLPVIAFPTLNGKIVTASNPEDEEEEEFMDEMEEEDEPPDTSADLSNTTLNSEISPEKEAVLKETEEEDDDKSASDENNKDSQERVKEHGGFIEQTVTNITLLKPDTSEIQKSNRDTLSYLKAKRISRHKNTDSMVELKKFKPSE